VPELIQLIYCSAEGRPFSSADLMRLLTRARSRNAALGVTGILLYSEGSFFQVLEGEPSAVDGLFADICRDKRHGGITLIIREPIARRSFGDWTMGYADVAPRDLDTIVGTNDFFVKGESFAQLGPGRAKKLLKAFRQGRWRAALGAGSPSVDPAPPEAPPRRHDYTFAFQPIVDPGAGTVFSYEALVRGRGKESAAKVLGQVSPSEMPSFQEQCRVSAIELASELGLVSRLSINFLPSSLTASSTAVSSVLAAAERCRLRPDQIILEILEKEIIQDLDHFVAAIHDYRGSGLMLAIDDFGAGHAGLNLLADFQPDLVKLDMHLIRGIESKGPRQAIVRGIARTCFDLGIDIIAEGVETANEFGWLQGAEIDLFQGHFFAEPAFERLPTVFHLPC